MITQHRFGNGQHLDEGALALYLAGKDAPEERNATEHHLATCAQCSARLAEQRAVRQLVAATQIARPVPARVRAALLERLAETDTPASHVTSNAWQERAEWRDSRTALVERDHPIRSSSRRFTHVPQRRDGRVAAIAAVAAVLAVIVASAAIFARFAPARHPLATPTSTPVSIVPSQVGIERIQMLSPTSGWAVGTQDTITSPNATAVILRYSNGHWQAVQAIPHAALLALSMDGPDDGWPRRWMGARHGLQRLAARDTQRRRQTGDSPRGRDGLDTALHGRRLDESHRRHQ
ncbi:MAG TPA: hypothetical protein VF120_14715 [Ktedonobacterales bacterium]